MRSIFETEETIQSDAVDFNHFIIYFLKQFIKILCKHLLIILRENLSVNLQDKN